MTRRFATLASVAILGIAVSGIAFAQATRDDHNSGPLVIVTGASVGNPAPRRQSRWRSGSVSGGVSTLEAWACEPRYERALICRAPRRKGPSQ
jgi:hypothetical protein